MQDERGVRWPFPCQQTPQRRQDEVHTLFCPHIPFQYLIVEQVKETDEGVFRPMVHEVRDVGRDAGERPVWTETPVEDIGEYSVWLTRSRTTAVSAKFGLYRKPPHGTQNTDIANDPSGLYLQAAIQSPISKAGMGFMKNKDVIVQDLLRHLVAVLGSSAAYPFVITAAGDAKQPAQQRDGITPAKLCDLLKVILLYFFGKRHLLSCSTPFFNLAISTFALANSYSRYST